MTTQARVLNYGGERRTIIFPDSVVIQLYFDTERRVIRRTVSRAGYTRDEIFAEPVPEIQLPPVVTATAAGAKRGGRLPRTPRDAANSRDARKSRTYRLRQARKAGRAED